MRQCNDDLELTCRARGIGVHTIKNLFRHGELISQFLNCPDTEIKEQFKILKVVRTMCDGEHLGEKALAEGKPRAATVKVSTERCSFVALQKNDYLKIVGTKYLAKIEYAVKTLRKFDLLSHLPNLVLKRLYLYMDEVSNEAGHYLYK